MTFTNNDICLIITYGQSNSVGVTYQYLYPSVSIAPSAYNVSKLENQGADTFKISHSMQYQRSVNDVAWGGNRISPITILGDLASQQIGQQTEVLLISAGMNGAEMAGIYKLTPTYITMQNAVSYAKQYADSKGKNLKAAYIAFVHGETDAGLGSALYAENVRDLRAYMTTDIKAITGQSEDPMFILSQIGWSYWSNASGTYPDKTMYIANEQIKSLNYTPSIRIATPGYIIPLDGQEFYAQNFQASHYSGDGCAQLAWYIHKAWIASSWPSFKCTSATLSGNEITLTTTPITGGVQVDIGRTCKDGKYGFEFKDLGNSSIGIASVVILNDTQIKVTLTATPTVSTKTIYYAYSMHFTYNWLQSFRQNGAIKDGDNNYLLSFSKTL